MQAYIVRRMVNMFTNAKMFTSCMSIYIIHAHAKLVFTISKMFTKYISSMSIYIIHAHAKLVFTISKMIAKLYEHVHKHAHARLVFTISKMFTKLYEHLHILIYMHMLNRCSRFRKCSQSSIEHLHYTCTY